MQTAKDEQPEDRSPVLPGIHHTDPVLREAAEIPYMTSRQRQAADGGRGGDLGVDHGLRAATPLYGGHELTPDLRRRLIERQDASFELPREVAAHPAQQAPAPASIRQPGDPRADLCFELSPRLTRI